MSKIDYQALRYGDNVLWFLNELAAYDASDIDGGEFDVYGEDRNGLEGCSTIDVTELAADAAKLIEAAEKRIAELESLTSPQLPQPAPVVPAALPENDDDDVSDIDYLEPSEVYALGRTSGWNVCRSAMLKSFGNSEQLDEVGSWNNHRNTPTAQDGNHTEQNLDMVDHFGDATQKAMLHGSEPETDNTNQQFESLGRGDK